MEETNRYAELIITDIHCTKLLGKDLNGLSDPYCTFTLASPSGTKTKLYTSSVIPKCLNPQWKNLNIHIYFSQEDMKLNGSALQIEVWDKDTITGDDFLGRLNLPLNVFLENYPSNPVYRPIKSGFECNLTDSKQTIVLHNMPYQHSPLSCFQLQMITEDQKERCINFGSISSSSSVSTKLIDPSQYITDAKKDGGISYSFPVGPFGSIDIGYTFRCNKYICDILSSKNESLSAARNLCIRYFHEQIEAKDISEIENESIVNVLVHDLILFEGLNQSEVEILSHILIPAATFSVKVCEWLSNHVYTLSKLSQHWSDRILLRIYETIYSLTEYNDIRYRFANVRSLVNIFLYLLSFDKQQRVSMDDTKGSSINCGNSKRITASELIPAVVRSGLSLDETKRTYDELRVFRQLSVGEILNVSSTSFSKLRLCVFYEPDHMGGALAWSKPDVRTFSSVNAIVLKTITDVFVGMIPPCFFASEYGDSKTPSSDHGKCLDDRYSKALEDLRSELCISIQTQNPLKNMVLLFPSKESMKIWGEGLKLIGCVHGGIIKLHS